MVLSSNTTAWEHWVRLYKHGGRQEKIVNNSHHPCARKTIDWHHHNFTMLIKLFYLIWQSHHYIWFRSAHWAIWYYFGWKNKKKRIFAILINQQHVNHCDVVEKNQHVVLIFFVIMITHSEWCYDQWPRRWHFAQHCCGGKGKKKK